MVIILEVAKSDKISCRKCGKRILKGINKGVIQEKGFNGYEVKKSFCLICIKEVILEKIKELNELITKIAVDEENWFITTMKFHCKKCNYEWKGRLKLEPRECPNCKSRRWKK
jgi:DNA-directed RNA polymerase subunit RPC12/RpoP